MERGGALARRRLYFCNSGASPRRAGALALSAFLFVRLGTWEISRVAVCGVCVTPDVRCVPVCACRLARTVFKVEY